MIHFKEGFSESYYTDEVKPLSEHEISDLKEQFYNKVSGAIDKGQLVSFAAKGDGQTELMDSKHAYSIIGAYKTDDIPSKCYFRLKNPWTKTPRANGLEYVSEDGEIKGKWINVKDGIFDVLMEDLIRDCDSISINGNENLVNTSHNKSVGYDIITDEKILENEKNQLTTDKLVDYIKVSNDLYDAMASTNSSFSHDSPEYKNLMEGIKEYRHDLAQSHGQNIARLKELTDSLMERVTAYENHVKKSSSPSGRQRARTKVCDSIRSMVNIIKEGGNPQQEFEKEYAKKLLEKYYDKNELQRSENIEEIAGKLYNNKVFRGIANATNIFKLMNPSEEQMEKHLADIEKNLKGRGQEKDVNISTMEKVVKPHRQVVKKNSVNK